MAPMIRPALSHDKCKKPVQACELIRILWLGAEAAFVPCVRPRRIIEIPSGVLYLVTAGDACELVSGPDAKDGAHSEVGVHNGGAIQGVEGHREAGPLQVHRLWHLLTAGVLHLALHKETDLSAQRYFMSALHIAGPSTRAAEEQCPPARVQSFCGQSTLR